MRISRRPRSTKVLLAALLAVGLIATAAIALSSDSATTGYYGVRSGDIDFGDVDLRVSTATFDARSGAWTCGPFSENLGDTAATSDAPARVCVRNVGDAAGELSVHTGSVTDREVGCSEREAAADPTCGNEGPGELASALYVTPSEADVAIGDREYTCESNFPIATRNEGEATVANLAAQEALLLDTLYPGQTRGLCLTAGWAESDASQSDSATWRYVFSLDTTSDARPQPCQDDPFEQNDTSTLMTPIDYDVTVDAMSCPGDEDWYRVPTSRSGSITVTLAVLEIEADLTLRIYDTYNNLLSSGGDGTVSVTGTGPYKVRVTNDGVPSYYEVRAQRV